MAPFCDASEACGRRIACSSRSALPHSCFMIRDLSSFHADDASEAVGLFTTAQKQSLNLPSEFSSRLFESLSPADLRAILAQARMRIVSRNEALQHEDEPGTHFSVLVTGFAEFSKAAPGGKRVFLRWVSPGDVFGLAALHPEPHAFLTTVTTRSEAAVLVWSHEAIHALLEKFPKLRENVCALANGYLALLADLLMSRISETAQQRLARIIAESAIAIGRSAPKGIELDLTNEQLSEMADVSRFTSSRFVSEWQRRGILRKTRGKLVVQFPEQLQRIGEVSKT